MASYLASGEKITWKEFSLTNDSPEDWISWWGLTHESVMRCKDDSVFGVIRYRRLAPSQEIEALRHIALPAVRRGWSMWLEEQYPHEGEEEACFLVLSWNPFFSPMGKIENALEVKRKFDASDMEVMLYHQLQEIAASFPKDNEAEILTYQDLIDFLAFTLFSGKHGFKMPDNPVDLDFYFFRYHDLDFSKNHVQIGDASYLVLSLPACYGSFAPEITEILQGFRDSDIPVRHVQRVLFFSEEEAKSELKGYAKHWCKSRRYIRDLILGDMEETTETAFYGYYNHHVIALVPMDRRGEVEAFLTQILRTEESTFLIEDYNAKDFWWGSLPGMFRAAPERPICRFPSLVPLLAGGRELPEQAERKEEDTIDVSDEPLPEEEEQPRG